MPSTRDRPDSDDSTGRPARRTVLGGSAALLAGLAGCSLTGGSSKGATDVVLNCMASAPVEVTLTITTPDADDPRIDRTLELDTGEQATPTDDGKLPAGGDYDVTVAVAGGPTETYRWTDVTLERAPMHVIVDGSENVFFTLQVG